MPMDASASCSDARAMLRTTMLTSGSIEWRRFASASQRRHARVANGFDGAEDVHLAITGRLRIAARLPLRVIGDERLGLRMIDREPLAHRLLAVVRALDQRLAGDVVAAGDPRRIELDVIGASRPDVDAPPAHALDDRRIGNVDLDHVVEDDP